jgi:hypothetical protein
MKEVVVTLTKCLVGLHYKLHQMGKPFDIAEVLVKHHAGLQIKDGDGNTPGLSRSWLTDGAMHSTADTRTANKKVEPQRMPE